MGALPLFGCVRALRDEGLTAVWPASERDRRGAGLRVVLGATGMPLRAGSYAGSAAWRASSPARAMGVGAQRRIRETGEVREGAELAGGFCDDHG